MDKYQINGVNSIIQVFRSLLGDIKDGSENKLLSKNNCENKSKD